MKCTNWTNLSCQVWWGSSKFFFQDPPSSWGKADIKAGGGLALLFKNNSVKNITQARSTIRIVKSKINSETFEPQQLHRNAAQTDLMKIHSGNKMSSLVPCRNRSDIVWRYLRAPPPPRRSVISRDERSLRLKEISSQPFFPASYVWY